jgi:CheY-like chemotaxis protein
MSTTTSASAPAGLRTTATNPHGIERRRRKRARISAQVHVRPVNSAEPFEEICKSVDVSRDGLLFLALRAGYWKGQQLDVTFPYSDAAASLNQAQRAEVLRVTEIGKGQFSVAVQFLAAKVDVRNERKGASADPFVGAAPPAAPDAVSTKDQSVVLAVEPDQRTADIMRNLLQNDGYTVVIVPTARQALEVLRTTVPAVFLAEVEAEDMSGHDLCLIIKRNERLQRVPVILLTRSAQPADYSTSHQLGAVVCMAKPFKPERLLHVVRLVAPPVKAGSAYSTRTVSNTVERSL